MQHVNSFMKRLALTHPISKRQWLVAKWVAIPLHCRQLGGISPPVTKMPALAAAIASFSWRLWKRGK
jgi:hypothetical protein